jgi:hypothetical protein
MRTRIVHYVVQHLNTTNSRYAWKNSMLNLNKSSSALSEKLATHLLPTPCTCHSVISNISCKHWPLSSHAAWLEKGLPGEWCFHWPLLSCACCPAPDALYQLWPTNYASDLQSQSQHPEPAARTLKWGAACLQIAECWLVVPLACMSVPQGHGGSEHSIRT